VGTQGKKQLDIQWERVGIRKEGECFPGKWREDGRTSERGRNLT
jgi:hypothetical protein